MIVKYNSCDFLKIFVIVVCLKVLKSQCVFGVWRVGHLFSGDTGQVAQSSGPAHQSEIG